MKWNQIRKPAWIGNVLSAGLLAFSFGAQAESYDVTYGAHDDGTVQRAIYFTENIAEPVKPEAALLFIHGMQSHAEWVEVSGLGDSLANEGIDVFAVDRRGSGMSESTRGHMKSVEQVMADLDQAVAELEEELVSRYGEKHGIELHVMANCFGARLIVPYLAELEDAGENKFESLTLIAPSNHMSLRASYNTFQKLKIARAEDMDLFPTPLKDEWFVGPGVGLDYIKSDDLALRKVTKQFLMTAKELTKTMNEEMSQLSIPLMIVVGNDDVMIKNRKTKKEVYGKYSGAKKWVELDGPHSLEFGPSADEFIEASADWITGSGAESRSGESESSPSTDELRYSASVRFPPVVVPPVDFGLH